MTRYHIAVLIRITVYRVEVFFACMLLGVLAGVTAGLFGLGGGVVIVPLLNWLLIAQGFAVEHTLLISVATSLASATLTSLSSVATHHKLGNILQPRVAALAPALFVGASLGALIAHYLSATLLRWLFVCYLIVTGKRLLSAPPANTQPIRTTRLLDILAGTSIGAVSALLGIGGGTMTVPYLAACGTTMKQAVGTSSACTLPIAYSAAFSYVLLGWGNENAANGRFWGYVYIPALFGIASTSIFSAPVGAKWAHRLPADTLKRYFGVTLLLIAVKMAW
ncbi:MULTISPECIES: sulfite exporter TauE/SafE family protein [Methylomonas]|uniref:sulfite exporter TauE/SafE family protein n=1 Tax=Methylomonas TaxID=416 RepID=UPI0012322E0B|nr:sulfite exporter TauE/SafE family protein [Methylomonas rhizoryzae]